ncbi:MAG: acetyl-CoA carboxylase, carboxyltransferase subunit beta [Rhodothermia bacterium]
MDWFRRKQAGILTEKEAQNETPDGYWVKCPECKEIVNRREVIENLLVCPSCEHHYQADSGTYLQILFDDGKYEQLFDHLRSVDPLEFVDSKPYIDRLEAAREKTPELPDAVLAGVGFIGGHRTTLAAMDFRFIGGSMGSVVGEVLTRSIQYAFEEKTPLVIVSQSGGARMMEGAHSLMQLAKTSANLARFEEAGLPYVSIMTHPTTGGVTASFAMLGDIHIAEPGALIGFAGPRIIRETIGKDLPEGFQRSEFLLQKGFLDRIVQRKDLQQTLIHIFNLLLEPASLD